MATYTLTKNSPTSAGYTLTATPLQVIISPNAALKNNQYVIIEKQTDSGWIKCQGEIVMNKEWAYSFPLKPAVYRFTLTGADDNSSVIVDAI